MSEKKMVSRNVAMALGIICIVLVASLAGTFIFLNDANQRNTSLQNQNNNLQSILSLNESFSLFNDETINATVPSDQLVPPYAAIYGYGYFIAPYSGYLLAMIYNSTVNPTDVWVSYTNPSVLGLEQTDVAIKTGSGSTLPILISYPNSSVYMEIGFYNSTVILNSATISITYYY